MTLEEFRNLETIEQIDYVNQFADGKKYLKDIEKEHFEFTNIGKYIKKEEAYWDKQKRLYIYIGAKDNIFTSEEILFLKQLYKRYKIGQNLSESIQQEEDKNDIVVRSVRINKDTINAFSKFCKDNHIIQSTALKIALEDFINKQEIS